MEAGSCLKCGSSERIDDVRFVEYDHNTPRDLEATIYQHPDAMISKLPISQRLRAHVCASCGYVEFYVENPGQLAAAAERAATIKEREKKS